MRSGARALKLTSTSDEGAGKGAKTANLPAGGQEGPPLLPRERGPLTGAAIVLILGGGAFLE
jgi:hypothetical protein